MCQVRPTTVKLAWQWNVVTLPGDILGLHLWCAAITHMPPWITPNWFDSLHICGKYCIQIMDIAFYFLAERCPGFFQCSWMWFRRTWWRHQMETFSALLVICAGNSPVPGEFPAQSQWRGVLMFSFICVWIKGWVNNRKAGDLRRYFAHYDVTVMSLMNDC